MVSVRNTRTYEKHKYRYVVLTKNTR